MFWGLRTLCGVEVNKSSALSTKNLVLFVFRPPSRAKHNWKLTFNISEPKLMHGYLFASKFNEPKAKDNTSKGL